jgi:transcriptional regulator with XRE-family HTH domain
MTVLRERDDDIGSLKLFRRVTSDSEQMSQLVSVSVTQLDGRPMTTPDSTEHLSRLLRAARAASKLSTRELGERLGLSQSRITRMQNGQAAVTRDMAKSWAEATGLPPDQTETLIQAAHSGGSGHKLRGSTPAQNRPAASRPRDISAIPEAATSVSECAIAVIPALLQVPAYATVVMANLSRISVEDAGAAITSAVAERMNNQAMLYDSSRSFNFVITEQALCYQPVSDDVAKAQAEKLTTLMTLPNVSISVLPCTASKRLAFLSGFRLYEIPEKPLVVVELLAGEATFTALPEVQLYRDSFTQIRKQAVTGRKAAEMIRRAASGSTS